MSPPPAAPLRARREVTADRAGDLTRKITERFNAHFQTGGGGGSRRADRVARHLGRVRAIQARHGAFPNAPPRRDGRYDARTGGWYTGD